mmetsp:Transcript_52554/g.157511  ORF Transcript_52554/g.157511 Transcript_52554/m.157511 type:complete len:99 (-) Transcript_52554:106-402(-)
MHDANVACSVPTTSLASPCFSVLLSRRNNKLNCSAKFHFTMQYIKRPNSHAYPGGEPLSWPKQSPEVAHDLPDKDIRVKEEATCSSSVFNSAGESLET